MSTKSSKAVSSATVVAAIRRGILCGELVSGQRLVEAEFCALLGASRSTVRSALMDLVHEGVLEHILQRGVRVRVVSLKEALQIAEVRLAVERLCVAKAAEKVTDKEIKKMRAMGKVLKLLAQKGDAIGFANQTHELFETYIHIADQPVAEEVLIRLRDCNSRHQFKLIYRVGRVGVALPFWLDIIDAICSRDPVSAQHAVERLSYNVQEAMKALAEGRTLLADK